MTKSDNLYISRVTFIFWTAIFIYYLRPPPLVRSKVQTKRHLPSDKIHTIFTYLEYSAAGPQSKDGRVCVTTGEGAGGATWPLAKPYITLACGQDPPGSLPHGGTHPPIFGLRSLRVDFLKTIC